MVSSDEEAGLVKKDAPTDGKDPLDPKNDPDLVTNGGKFQSKVAILQVTWRFPVDPDPLNILALIYGYLPFVVPVVFFVDMLVEWRFIAFYGLVTSAVVTLLNEVIFKPILKQPRPEGSANRKFNDKTGKWEMKPGMPSGHVANAATTMVWCLLEVALRGPGFDDQPFLTTKILLLIIVCMGPVPWARIHNQDHSLAQCTVAGIMGIVAGVTAYLIRVTYFPLGVGQEWCYQSLCLIGGKPWDPFVDGPQAGSEVVTAAAITTTLAQASLTIKPKLHCNAQQNEALARMSSKPRLPISQPL
ncbi:unnamed protein product [Symbiodinium pilosum]|uniref:Phosphatidic acid phosphatase type 2/haloperoxidase domain-containing protein n=1 Tax=Symbiodinium pilosum TaxID=2952 RepID=A0A812WGZ4_SYMPI|nr:unnamed protein product [Symbiodinium pilosum]